MLLYCQPETSSLNDPAGKRLRQNRAALWAELAEPPVGQISMLLFHFGDHKGPGRRPGESSRLAQRRPPGMVVERLGGGTVGVRQSRQAGCANSQLCDVGYVI